MTVCLNAATGGPAAQWVGFCAFDLSAHKSGIKPQKTEI